MSIKLTEPELEEYLTRGHTLILATIRKSGEPFMTPLWYVWRDGAFIVRTPARSAKAKHIARDPRVCVLVEDGKAWVDLRAVVANCDAERIEDKEAIRLLADAIDTKYAGFRRDTAKTPAATERHYATMFAYFKLTPRPGEIRSWYNRKIRARG